MDRSGADFFEVVRQMKDVLGANPCPIVVPIGAEESFKGLVDLIKMKAIYWHDETMGADYSVEEIPAELVDEANEWRDKMLEKVAEFDDALMEKYFDDPSTITEEEVLRALRNATVQMAVVPMLCGSSFKNKGVHAVNVTDNQSSVMRLGSLAMCKVLKDAGMNPIFQLIYMDSFRRSYFC